MVRRGSAGGCLLLRVFCDVVWRPGDLRLPRGALCLSGPRLWFVVVLFVAGLSFRGGSLTGVGFAVRAGQLDGCFGPLVALGRTRVPVGSV